MKGYTLFCYYFNTNLHSIFYVTYCYFNTNLHSIFYITYVIIIEYEESGICPDPDGFYVSRGTSDPDKRVLITFFGNEFTIGIMLACWIGSEALGSAAASRLANKPMRPFILFYAGLQAIISVYLPVSILLIRDIKNLVPLIPGEAAGLIPVIGSWVLFEIGPLDFIHGMQFPVGCRIYGLRPNLISTPGVFTPGVAGRVYILEAAGFTIAGLLFA